MTHVLPPSVPVFTPFRTILFRIPTIYNLMVRHSVVCDTALARLTGGLQRSTATASQLRTIVKKTVPVIKLHAIFCPRTPIVPDPFAVLCCGELPVGTQVRSFPLPPGRPGARKNAVQPADHDVFPYRLRYNTTNSHAVLPTSVCIRYFLPHFRKRSMVHIAMAPLEPSPSNVL